MVGSAESITKKKRKARAEQEKLIERAVEAYIKEQGIQNRPQKGIRKVCDMVSEEYHREKKRWVHISKTTVMARLKGRASLTKAREAQSWLNEEEDERIIEYTLELAARGFPLNHKRLRDVADSILRARLGSSFSGVGENWTDRFVERHSDHLQTYWTRSLDSLRGRAVNPATNNAWFDLVNKTVADYNITPELSWGTDEVGFNPALAEKQRGIGRRGRKMLYQQRDGIRENITIIATICADGTSLPPAVIFKGTGYQVRWKQNNPLNALLGYQKKGWTDGIIGVAWIKNFDVATRAKAAGRYRLIFVDGHNSHYTAAFLSYARQHRILILCYPSHTTHVYQGLDVAVFGILKTRWTEVRDDWERNKHQKVTKDNFLELLGRAWVSAVTPATVKSAFEKTGIWPYNRSVIPTDAMAPSRVTTSRAALPIVHPSPIRVVARIFHHAMHELVEEEEEEDVIIPGDGPVDDNIDIDPVLQSARHARQHLASTSAAFLVSGSPIRSTSQLPTFTLPLVTRVPRNELLDLEPRTENERRLLASLREHEQRAKQYAKERSNERAIIVLQAQYCEDVRSQLVNHEEKKLKSKNRGKLVGDGLPRLLTGDEFFERVTQHEANQKAEAIEKEARKTARASYASALVAWKSGEEKRKRKNEETKGRWKEAVALWEKERDLAKAEKRRAGWKKPSRGPLIGGLPRPKSSGFGASAARSDVESEDDELDSDQSDGEEDELQFGVDASISARV